MLRLLLLRFWLVFELAEDPDEVDIFGGFCTVFALPLNALAWITMIDINGWLTIIISVLSILWLCMRVYREWGATKEYYASKQTLDEEP